MASLTCPHCRIISPAGTVCCDCGYDFASRAMRSWPSTAAPAQQGYLADTIAWQHRYCVFMTVVYVLSIAMGVFMVTFRNEGASGHNSAEDLFMTGMVLIVMGVVLTIAYGVAPRLVPAPWVWTYHLILIAFAFTSPCCLPIAIPLLIRWIKPDTKQYYGRA